MEYRWWYFTRSGGIIRCFAVCSDLYEYLERKKRTSSNFKTFHPLNISSSFKVRRYISFLFSFIKLDDSVKRPEICTDVDRRKTAITNSVHLFYTIKFGLLLRQKKSNFVKNSSKPATLVR